MKWNNIIRLLQASHLPNLALYMSQLWGLFSTYSSWLPEGYALPIESRWTDASIEIWIFTLQATKSLPPQSNILRHFWLLSRYKVVLVNFGLNQRYRWLTSFSQGLRNKKLFLTTRGFAWLRYTMIIRLVNQAHPDARPKLYQSNLPSTTYFVSNAAWIMFYRKLFECCVERWTLNWLN
jgi:hypothetical protein